MAIQGTISEYDEDLGVLHIVAPYPPDEAYILKKRKIRTCEIRLDDGRTISAEQRGKIYATLSDIALWSGHEPEEIKALMKYDFIVKTGYDRYFSLSDVDMTTANRFLEHIIEFCIVNDIPCADQSYLERAPDIGRYLYWCVINRKCAVCGRKADIHEYDAVGQGRNRNTIHHVGVRVVPLCRVHHTEAEQIGRDTFLEKHHLTWVRLDADACEILKWKK